jgi:hypothetical protein
MANSLGSGAEDELAIMRKMTLARTYPKGRVCLRGGWSTIKIVHRIPLP